MNGALTLDSLRLYCERNPNNPDGLMLLWDRYEAEMMFEAVWSGRIAFHTLDQRIKSQMMKVRWYMDPTANLMESARVTVDTYAERVQKQSEWEQRRDEIAQIMRQGRRGHP